MKKIIFLFAIILPSVLFTQCIADSRPSKKGNGNLTKEQRNVESFKGISASSGVNVYLTQGEKEEVIVETDENIQKCIITEVENGTLKCKVDCRIVHSTKLDVYVTFKNIDHIRTSSGADVTGNTTIIADDLSLSASSGGDMKLEVDAKNLTCDVSSGGDIKLTGKTVDFKGGASSGGDIKAKDLTSENANLTASSAGNISTTVTKEVLAHASSGGDITYYGNPTTKNTSESSGGDVKNR